MRQLRLPFDEDQYPGGEPSPDAQEDFADAEAAPLPREIPYDNLDWEWEIEHGVPLPSVAVEVADFLGRELFGISLSDWSTQGPELMGRLKSERHD